jgi:hypothetical protein
MISIYCAEKEHVFSLIDTSPGSRFGLAARFPQRPTPPIDIDKSHITIWNLITFLVNAPY